MYDAAVTRAMSRTITRQVSGIGIRPTCAKERNNVPTSNLSATGSKKLPSLEACEIQVRAIHPSARSLNPANTSNHSAICAMMQRDLKSEKHIYNWAGLIIIKKINFRKKEKKLIILIDKLVVNCMLQCTYIL